MELAAWLGLGLGLVCFAASAYGGTAPRRLYAAHGTWPSPDQITAYVTAISGAILTIANTGYIVWHKLNPGPRKPRKRKPRRERTDHAEATPKPA
jgi:hypothetical protein